MHGEGRDGVSLSLLKKAPGMPVFPERRASMQGVSSNMVWVRIFRQVLRSLAATTPKGPDGSLRLSPQSSTCDTQILKLKPSTSSPITTKP